MRVTFQEIKTRRERSGPCIRCGKRRKRTMSFSQTVNPFNLSAATKQPKTVEEIHREIHAEGDAWLASPMICASCEGLL